MYCIDLRWLECAKGTQYYYPHTKHRRCAVWGNNAYPMRVEDTQQNNGQQGSVPPARRIKVSVPTPHETKCRVGLIRLRAFSTFIGH